MDRKARMDGPAERRTPLVSFLFIFRTGQEALQEKARDFHGQEPWKMDEPAGQGITAPPLFYDLFYAYCRI